MIGLSEYDAETPKKSELPEKPLKEWRRIFEAGNLDPSNLMQYFQTASPFFFTVDQFSEFPQELARFSFDEQGTKNAILDELEEFIFGDNPQTVLAKIRSEESSSTICGHVFKINEPFYSCRECGMDPTCVLCVNCFKQSAHRRHKYKMGTSAGGGCCDCGDTEAWKQDSSCDEHKKTEQILHSNYITERMRERCSIVFDAILNYCVRSLKLDANGSLKNLEEDIEEDIYCTVLYNDETHTFDQVINTLTRIVGWPQKEAIEYVSMIDREGRAVVKCSTFQKCLHLKSEIEKQNLRPTVVNKPTVLKVAVLHKNAVAYQQLSLQLLAWFQEFLSRHAVFRFIFCEILKKQDTDYGLRDILANDSILWKTARTSWHRLLISGMLMEYENKKTLAVSFTRQYTRIMQDFIHDDHDHSFSIVSMSVQLFTVPSIAQHLIANESAFYKLLYTFYSESIEKYVKKKVLQFTRNSGSMNIFKRASYILFDIKYILSFKPEVWTDELRKNFLHGVQLMIKLLREMQGMDSVYRQTGQHMEYEPEWESAFNLHIKLAPVISLVLDWCSSDRVVLIKVYRMVLSALTECDFIVSQATPEIKELADHSVWCQMYDVSSKQVSIHLPLSRFFAGLYLLLEKFGLSFDTVALKKKPDQEIEPKPDHIIEPVLCSLTMVAQVHAGMWRRNGYSLLNQLYFYRNVKCRSEMLDRDVIALQIGASLIESNEFLIHVVNKFGLINWLNADYEANSLSNPEEDSIRQIINMVDELLELIIVIVSERHVPGVGIVSEEDKIKKEIIQFLCIKPFSHSELSRVLPECQREEHLENIIEKIAVFKKPSQSDKMGVYELKPEFYNEYNMYFYHYTKEEKSKSEEEQRKRRKAKKELVCCPPPKLPQLTQLFSMLANLLQCDVMLLIMQTILKRALDLKARSFAESHLQKVLYLIGYAVQEQESGAYPFFTFHERGNKWNILSMMEELINNPRVEGHRDLILWTVRKYKTLQALTSGQSEMESDESFAQSSKQADESMADAEKAEKQDRARLAAERRAQVMAQMANAQKSFMSTNADLFESTATSVSDKNESVMEWQDNNDSKLICLGPYRKFNYVEDLVVTCILCSEDSVVNKSSESCMVYSAFVQKSRILLAKDTIPYPHTSSCGHVMHAHCWKEYFDNEVLKENRRPNRNRSQGSTTEKKEFLCPLCRCLSNAVIPISPALSRMAPAQVPTADDPENTQSDTEPMPFDKWLYFMQNYNSALQLITDLPEISEKTQDASLKFPDLGDIVKEFSSIESFMKLAPPSTRELLTKELSTYVEDFAMSAKRAAPTMLADEITEPHLITWLSCSYTIQSMEMYLRALNKPLKGQMSIRQTSCLYGLIRESGLLVTTINDEIAAKLMTVLRSHLATLFTNSSSCFIELDLFRMLITFIFITPSVLYARTKQCVVPDGTLLEYYLLKMIFLATVTKILVLHNIEDIVEDMDQTESIASSMDIDGNATILNRNSEEVESNGSNETDVLIEFYNNHNFYVIDARDSGINPPSANKTPKQIKELIIKAIHSECQVFLRCACMLFQFLTDVDLPDELYDTDGDRFDVMCEYLGLSSDIETYLKCDSINSYMSNLAMHPDIEMFRTKRRTELPSVLVPCVPKIRKLIDLPEDYSDLINTVLTFSCPNNDRDHESSRNPTLCLICGITLCSNTYCCQYEIEGTTVGACTNHAHECGAGVGIFLRIRECDILLLGLNKGSFVSPPYLDKYGETDQGLRRGNPLKLCLDRYQKLNLLWLNHGLHEDIARSVESMNSVIPTQWQHL